MGHIIFKHLTIHLKAKEKIKTFPREISRKIGEALRKVQYGLFIPMPMTKPMPIVARGVYELRLKDQYVNYRIFYYTKDSKRILVLHAFIKKSQATSTLDIKLGQLRLREMTR